MKAIGHLLAPIRPLASRSAFVRDLYLEVVYRMIKCDCMLLRSQDHNRVGKDVAEHDFRDFQKARLERLDHLARTSSYHVTHPAPDEVLLDDSTGRETPEMPSAPSPRLDALDIRNNSAVQVPPTGLHSDPNLSTGVNVEISAAL
ncbi:hypothetical protein AAWM_04259 [Aspergillus awamori]|uniref:Uncharacterized protein n=1 Tax=Aspergillus awamori TaxID=105351 RepID=A0A401KQ19_ASPAW|nr:hypothetical protein AAWM_04259 [Aspergillus awamori]